MRPPRLRFRLRTLMALSAISAALLWAWLLIDSARAASAREQCASNLRYIGLTLANYATSRGAFPPGTVINPSLPPDRRLSWWAFLGGYIEQGLQFLLDLAEPWDGGANRVPMFRLSSVGGDPPPSTVPAGDFRLVQCPAHRHPASPAGACETDYVGIAGLGTDAPTLPAGHPRAGMFGYDRQAAPADIKDGAAFTLLIVETASANGPWTRGGPATVRGLDPSRRPYIGRGHQFGGTHPGGANALFADGSVRFLGETVDARVLEALATIAGGERLPPGWDR